MTRPSILSRPPPKGKDEAWPRTQRKLQHDTNSLSLLHKSFRQRWEEQTIQKIKHEAPVRSQRVPVKLFPNFMASFRERSVEKLVGVDWSDVIWTWQTPAAEQMVCVLHEPQSCTLLATRMNKGVLLELPPWPA